MPLRSRLLTSTSLATFGTLWVAGFAAAADFSSPILSEGTLPAVSETNFKIEGFGGWADGDTSVTNYGDGLVGAAGALTIPLSHQYGFQVDGTVGDWSGDGFAMIGGHLFWRDPSQGLIGIYGSYSHLDRGAWSFISNNKGIDLANLALEGEYYLDGITLKAVAGWEGGEVKDRFFSHADLAWYATPDLSLSIGHRYVGGDNALALGSEWLLPVSHTGAAFSLFGEARIGEDDYQAFWGGIRVYFGPSRTLIDKHRMDDPDAPLDNLFAIQSLVDDLDKKNRAAELSSAGGGGGVHASDRELKRDLTLLALLDSGIALYRYRYLWSDVFYVGVIAQEVAEICPEAVTRTAAGHLRVNYALLGLRMTTWREWKATAGFAHRRLAA
jgi:hypothetical protein